MIELHEITVKFDDTVALDNTSFHVKEGEIISIIGPNGSGKTTLLRVMAGLLRPNSGNMWFEDEPVLFENLLDYRKRVTMVFQNPTVFGTSVFKNVAYGLRIRNIDEEQIKTRVENTLDTVGLLEFQNRSARSLSGGEQRRLCLAMGMVLEPDLLLLDEPTSYLDADNLQNVTEILTQLNENQATTIVIATHNIFHSSTISDRIATMRSGSIERMGPVKDVVLDELEELALETSGFNVYSGMATDVGSIVSGKRVVQVSLENNVRITAVSNHTGSVTVRIPPEDIIVSHQPVLSSARNSLKGKLKEITRNESLVLLTIDVGVDMVVQITSSSLDTLDVSENDPVILTFKASSVRVY